MELKAETPIADTTLLNLILVIGLEETWEENNPELWMVFKTGGCDVILLCFALKDSEIGVTETTLLEMMLLNRLEMT